MVPDNWESWLWNELARELEPNNTKQLYILQLNTKVYYRHSIHNLGEAWFDVIYTGLEDEVKTSIRVDHAMTPAQANADSDVYISMRNLPAWLMIANKTYGALRL